MTEKTFLTPAYDSILKLQAYQTGKSVEDLKREYEVNDVLKLGSNENPLGSSPNLTWQILMMCIAAKSLWVMALMTY